MKSLSVRFNLFLFAALLLTACHTDPKKAEKKPEKQATAMSFHLECNRDGTPYNAQVPIFREKPMMVNVEKNPVLDVGDMAKAEVVDVDKSGGFAIKIKFSNRGALNLANVTTANKGRRMAILAKWTEQRWIAAPRITHDLNDGVLIFTPDASREESERIVRGLNNVIKQLGKPYTF
jgi:preprotein translocase subunit SecD